MMDRNILEQIKDTLDELNISVSPEIKHKYEPDEDTIEVDYTFNVLTYRDLEIGQFRYYKNQPNIAKVEFISKIALSKRQRPYWRFVDLPYPDDKLMTQVLNYAVPIYRDHMPKGTYTCPGHYWKFSAFHARTKDSLITTLRQIVKYVDTELEEDPSKVNGWNFVARMKQFIEHERKLLDDVDCVRRLDCIRRRTIQLPDTLMDVHHGTLENGHKYDAILVHDDGHDHRCHAIHTYKAGGDGMYFILNTYKFRYENVFAMKPSHMVGLVQLRKMYMDFSTRSYSKE